ncbi:MAG: glycosyltransferase [Planctomycetes bacterium]|nr:glycosyltransferase [Planctomycetota bacterium]
MYLLVTQAPIYLEGGVRPWLRASWRRSLLLLREALEDRLGPVMVLGPSLPREVAGAGLEEVQAADGLRMLPSVDLRASAGGYWLRERNRWRADVRVWVGRARAVHAGLTEDLWRPLAFEGFREARRQERPAVFFLGADPVARREAQARGQGAVARVAAQMYGTLFDGAARYAVRTADLALLRAGGVHRRYARHSRNGRAFHEARHLAAEVVPAALVEERARGRAAGQPLRAVCCAPLEPGRGVDDAIDVLRLARQRGVALTLDLAGDGSDRRRLESRVASLGLRAAVRFVTAPPGGAERARWLAGHEVLLVTSTADDADREVLDGFSAGLPAVGYAGELLRQRVEEDGAAIAVRAADVDAVARALADLARDGDRLAQLSRAAHRAGRYHAADAWHRRRAAWTLEAVEAHDVAARAGRVPASMAA